MKNFDTINLRHEAHFEVKLFNDVFWVPINTLGKSKLSNSEINKIQKLSPELKQKYISNLYEAVQLFEASKFKEYLDIKLVEDENNLVWEYHKPGYYSVIQNKGCCSSASSWLTYILKEKYDEIGLISISNINGNGHVLNYIKHNGFYYFIDLSCFYEENLKFSIIETGKLSDFRKTKFITALCLKSKKIESFADYFCKYMSIQSKDFLIFKHKDYECVPLSISLKEEKTIINFPKNSKIVLINNKRKSPKMEVNFLEHSIKTLDWYK